MTVWAAWTAVAILFLALAAAVGRRRCCSVYEYYDAAGVPLYVGMSYSPKLRARAHMRRSWWRYVDHSRTRVTRYRSRSAAAAAERARIRRLRPVANVTHNGGCGRRARVSVQGRPRRSPATRPGPDLDVKKPPPPGWLGGGGSTSGTGSPGSTRGRCAARRGWRRLPGRTPTGPRRRRQHPTPR